MVSSRAECLERLASCAIRVEFGDSEKDAIKTLEQWVKNNYPNAVDTEFSRRVDKHPTGEQYVSVNVVVYGNKQDANKQ